MTAEALKRFFAEWDELRHDYDDDSMPMKIDCDNFTTDFCMCDQSEWSIDEGNVLYLVNKYEGTVLIDIDSIKRIRLV